MGFFFYENDDVTLTLLLIRIKYTYPANVSPFSVHGRDEHVDKAIFRCS